MSSKNDPKYVLQITAAGSIWSNPCFHAAWLGFGVGGQKRALMRHSAGLNRCGIASWSMSLSKRLHGPLRNVLWLKTLQSSWITKPSQQLILKNREARTSTVASIWLLRVFDSCHVTAMSLINFPIHSCPKKTSLLAALDKMKMKLSALWRSQLSRVSSV